jgi:CheY-like chemotaxis protein
MAGISSRACAVRCAVARYLKEVVALNFDQAVKLFEIIISFIQVISWPLVILIILFLLRAPLKKFLENIGEINLKAGPFETTAKRQQLIEASTWLGAATEHWQKETSGGDTAPDPEKMMQLADRIDRLMTPETVQRLQGASALWVDDRAMLTSYERRALEALGIQFTISKSTEDALERLQRKTYDVIISDMSRPPDKYAGYTLLEKMRSMGITTPVIIYASGKKPEYAAEAERRGAFGSTNEPQKLLEMVIQAIRDSSAPTTRQSVERSR